MLRSTDEFSGSGLEGRVRRDKDEKGKSLRLKQRDFEDIVGVVVEIRTSCF